MGNQASVGSFVGSDAFLRRVDRKRRIREGIVSWEAFRDSHPTLSFTYRDQSLKTEDGLDTYWKAKALLHGDLPGICQLTFVDLTEFLWPPLPPRYDPDEEDEVYGHLHCCTDKPAGQTHMEEMAKLATRNGVVRDFVPKRKRML